MREDRKLAVGHLYHFDNDRGTAENCLRVIREMNNTYRCIYYDELMNEVRKGAFTKNGIFCRKLRLDQRHEEQKSRTLADQYGMGEKSFQEHLDRQRIEIAKAHGIDPKVLGVSNEAIGRIDISLIEKGSMLHERILDMQKKPRAFRSIPNVQITIEGDNMRTIISKLNNPKSEERTFDQPVIEEKSIKLSLLDILKNSALVNSLKLGEKAILKDIAIVGDKIVFRIDEGEVVYDKKSAE